MKQYFFFIFCFVMIAFRLSADDGNNASINLQHQNQHDNHSEYYPPADMPEAYFDSNDMEIIIVGDGFADYYDVEIVSLGSMLTVIGTQIDGYGDSIDVSLLPDGDYRLVITSSNNNVYEEYQYDAADVNGDGYINPTDATVLTNMVLNGVEYVPDELVEE